MQETSRGTPPTTRRDRAWAVTKEMWREVQSDSLFDTAAGVAFWLLLSLPAAVLAILASVSLLGDGLTADLRDAIDSFVERTFATESDTIRDAVDSVFDRRRPGLLTGSVAIAIFTLSRGFAGLIRALDVAYDVEESRRFWRVRLTAIGMAIGSMLTIAAATFLWVESRAVGVPTVFRLLGALALLIAWAATMFHVGPHHRTPWRYDLPGALLAAVGWLIVSIGFGWYVQIAGSGNELVGAAGAALLGLTWLWLACVVFLLGAELNEILADRAGVIQDPSDFGARLKRLYTSRWRDDES